MVIDNDDNGDDGGGRGGGGGGGGGGCDRHRGSCGSLSILVHIRFVPITFFLKILYNKISYNC